MSNEEIAGKVNDLLISNVASWTSEKQEEINNLENGKLSLYANDYVRNFVEMENIQKSEDEINEIIENVILEYKTWLYI